jgi:hypothetical protein
LQQAATQQASMKKGSCKTQLHVPGDKRSSITRARKFKTIQASQKQSTQQSIQSIYHAHSSDSGEMVASGNDVHYGCTRHQ